MASLSTCHLGLWLGWQILLILYINTLTLGEVWQYLLSGADIDSPLSKFLRLLGPMASDLPIGDVLKNAKAVILSYLLSCFVPVGQRWKQWPNCDREPLSRGRNRDAIICIFSYYPQKV